MKSIKKIGSLVYRYYIYTVFFLTLLLFYFPLLPFLSSEKRKKASYPLFVWWGKLFRVCIGVRIQKNHRTLPEGPFVIVANHTSYLDIFLMYSLFPKHPLLFLGKSELLKYPMIGTFFRKLHIPVFRGEGRKAAQSYFQSLKAIDNGWCLVIFPEGGIPDNGCPQLAPFKEGAFKIAKNKNIPIVPITFANNFELFEDPMHFWGKARPGIAKVIIHAPIEKDEIEEKSLKEVLIISEIRIKNGLSLDLNVENFQ